MLHVLSSPHPSLLCQGNLHGHHSATSLHRSYTLLRMGTSSPLWFAEISIEETKEGMIKS